MFFKIENIFLFSFRKSKKRPWKRELLTCFFMRERAYQFLIIYPKLTRSFCPIQKISKMSLKLILKNIAALCNIFFVSIVFLYKKSNSYVHAQAFLKSSFNWIFFSIFTFFSPTQKQTLDFKIAKKAVNLLYYAKQKKISCAKKLLQIVHSNICNLFIHIYWRRKEQDSNKCDCQIK